MNVVLVYLFKVILIHGILFILYRFLLQKSNHHQLNRFYLLFSVAVAFVIPFIDLSEVAKTNQLLPTSQVNLWIDRAQDSVQVIPINQLKTDFTWWGLIPYLIGLISFTLLIRSLFFIYVLEKIRNQSIKVPSSGFNLFRTQHDKAFSFLKNIFMPDRLFCTPAYDPVLAHERVHVRQFHSIDRLLLDFIVSLFWFNPFIRMYRNALIEIHEYQADEGVINRFEDPVEYHELLFSQLQSPGYYGFASHFNVKLIKKRIVMMNKTRKTKRWIYSLIVPVILSTIFAFSSKESLQPINTVGKKITTYIGPQVNVFTSIEKLLPQDYRPSIFPLKNQDVAKITSHFGRRVNPLTDKYESHKGTDFKCDIGTEVVATADGTIKKIENLPDGYGKLLTVSHGEEFITRYAQLSEFKVKEGEKVVKGQVVALSGNSGKSTGPHLHYEIHRNGKPVNPVEYIVSLNTENVKKARNEVQKAEEEAQKADLERKAQEEELALAEKQRAKAEKRRKLSEEEKIAQKREMEAEMRAKEMAERKRVEESRRKEKEVKPSVELTKTSGGIDVEKDKPYILVDDKEVENSYMKKINPNSIESINVLKGETALDKYGSKAQNGAIEIFLKKKE